MTPPPAVLNMTTLYRARVPEVHALDLGDGRHVLLTEPPRYMDSADFLRQFEPAFTRRETDQVMAELTPASGNGRGHLNPGTPDAEVQRPDLAAAIAARTTPGGPGPGRLPRTAEEVERVLAETRTQVETEQRVDAMGVTTTSRGRPKNPPKPKKPGKGFKLCKECNGSNGTRASICRDCGAAF
jgi:hypothetical protein